MRIIGVLWPHLNHTKSPISRPIAPSRQRRSFRTATKLLFWTFVVAACLSPCIDILAFAGGTTYVYDPLGRLVAVVDGSGNAAAYKYNNVGNLLSISTT